MLYLGCLRGAAAGNKFIKAHALYIEARRKKKQNAARIQRQSAKVHVEGAWRVRGEWDFAVRISERPSVFHFLRPFFPFPLPFPFPSPLPFPFPLGLAFALPAFVPVPTPPAPLVRWSNPPLGYKEKEGL